MGWWIDGMGLIPVLSFGLWILVELGSKPTATRWERRIARLLVLLAGVVAWQGNRESPGELDLAAVERAYVETWHALDRTAEVLVGVLEPTASEPPAEGRLALFELLDAGLRGAAEPAPTVLLFDPRGEVVAWHGPGLLHEPDVDLLPDEGHLWHRAFTTASLWRVRSFGEPGRLWRLVVGRSLPQQPFPFAPGVDGVSWTLIGDDPISLEESAAGGPEPLVLRPSPDLPGLWLQRTASAVAGTTVHESLWRGSLLFLVILPAVLWAGRRVFGPAGSEPASWPTASIGVLALASVPVALGLPFGLQGGAGLVVSLSLLLTAMRRHLSTAGREPSPRATRMEPIVAAVAGASIFGVVGLGAWWVQSTLGRVDLATPDAGATGLAVGSIVSFAVLGFFLWIPRRAGAVVPLWPAVLLGGAAAALHDGPWVWLLGIGAASMAGLWWSTADRSALARSAALALIVASLSSLAWQSAERVVLRHSLEFDYLPEMAPPTEDELNDLLLLMEDHFSSWSPSDEPFESIKAPSWSRDDLAFKLWQDSPLASRDGLSALFVRTVEGESSSFSFGLPLGEAGEAPRDFSRLRIPHGPEWSALATGEMLIEDGGRPWGELRYFFLPRPGFRFEGLDELAELQRNLVREKPRGDMADGLPRGAEYAYFDLDGRALASPWDTLPALPADRLADLQRAARMETPDGVGWSWLRVEDEGITAIFLPVFTPSAGLERIGFVALTLFPWSAASIFLLWWVPSSGAGWTTALRNALRSYSTRLILVYTVLLLVPLIALNLILLRSFSERLRAENLSDAQEAMVSARHFLVSYLNGLETGVFIETMVNRDLLEWMSDLVQHQVNLYWGSRIYRSSQEELFTAGLLPRRIPAEIFSRLTLHGHGMEFRRRQTTEPTYLEVYAPLDVPGVLSSQQELFVSVPLLEQEEVAERRFAELRRRALLVTSALFVLLWAAGSRLTRNFTRPIEEIIEGTGRIARGEPFPDIRPRETELSALAQAIHDMSREVDESRRGLLREKRFVEKVVGNITSAVVSLDRDDRVVFQNKVAADLLGTRVGDAIEARLDSEPMLRPVVELWHEVRNLDGPVVRQIKLRPVGETVDVREWTLTWVPITGEGGPAALLVVDDDTEVLRGQRLEAWAEMARIIAHEIKNPLTPIQLSAEHLRQVRRVEPGRFDEIFDRCTDNILSNVAELRAIASEFSIYSRIPAAQMETADLGRAMADLAAAYHDAAGHGVEIELHAPDEPVGARFDEKLLGRAVRNLLENAFRAASMEGGSVVLRVGAPDDGTMAEIEVADSGPGVDPQKLERIFEPYFSTYESGTGLGLAIVKRIVHEHGGEVEARNRPSGGLSVIIRIPLAVLSSETD